MHIYTHRTYSDTQTQPHKKNDVHQLKHKQETNMLYMHVRILPNSHLHASTHKCAHILTVSADSGRTDRRHMAVADCEPPSDSNTLKRSTHQHVHE